MPAQGRHVFFQTPVFSMARLHAAGIRAVVSSIESAAPNNAILSQIPTSFEYIQLFAYSISHANSRDYRWYSKWTNGTSMQRMILACDAMITVLGMVGAHERGAVTCDPDDVRPVVTLDESATRAG